jgi:hypothetical protein
MARLMNELRPRLPGALDTAIQFEMFSMLTEFFERTNVWREDISVVLVVNTTSYELVPTGPASIHRLVQVLNTNLRPVSATMSVPGTMVLATAPTQIDTLTATVVLNVVDPTDKDAYPQFPAWVLDKYRLAFVDGLLGRLHSQPAKPYSNQQLAVYHMRRWRQAMAIAKVEVQRNNVFAAQSWRYPQGFAVRRRR